MANQKLTPKQEMFAREYLVDLNGTQAYLRAGYKAKNEDVAGANAARLLGNDRIQARIRELMAERSGRTEITADWVVTRMKAEAVFDGEGASHSARVAALKILGQHVNIFKDKTEHTGKDDRPIEFIILPHGKIPTNGHTNGHTNGSQAD